MHNRIDITTCVMKSNELHLKADPIETEIEQLKIQNKCLLTQITCHLYML